MLGMRLMLGMLGAHRFRCKGSLAASDDTKGDGAANICGAGCCLCLGKLHAADAGVSDQESGTDASRLLFGALSFNSVRESHHVGDAADSWHAGGGIVYYGHRCEDLQ